MEATPLLKLLREEAKECPTSLKKSFGNTSKNITTSRVMAINMSPILILSTTVFVYVSIARFSFPQDNENRRV